jgi:hypothetical protein
MSISRKMFKLLITSIMFLLCCTKALADAEFELGICDLSVAIENRFSYKVQIQNKGSLPFPETVNISGIDHIQIIDFKKNESTKCENGVVKFDLNNFGDVFWSTNIYSPSGENERYRSKFLIEAQGDDQKSKVTITGYDSSVIRGEKCCGLHGAYSNYVTVKSSKEIEKQIEQYIKNM